jgi:putative transposase
MYRILHANDEVRERRNVLRHPQHKKPELVATGPNQVWSWDITKLKGSEKWHNYYLYVIIDIYSRYVVGWMVARTETAALATRLIEETCQRQGIKQDQLIIHSDRGSPMTAKVTAQLLADLGVTKSLGRPKVCNDNCYSESYFKTLKYHPTFPERFGSIQDARSFLHGFFTWYNEDHYHSGIAYMTPQVVHAGQAQECARIRQAALCAAFSAHPERFVRGLPVAQLPTTAWINPPRPASDDLSLRAITGGGTLVATSR